MPAIGNEYLYPEDAKEIASNSTELITAVRDISNLKDFPNVSDDFRLGDYIEWNRTISDNVRRTFLSVRKVETKELDDGSSEKNSNSTSLQSHTPALGEHTSGRQLLYSTGDIAKVLGLDTYTGIRIDCSPSTHTANRIVMHPASRYFLFFLEDGRSFKVDNSSKDQLEEDIIGNSIDGLPVAKQIVTPADVEYAQFYMALIRDRFKKYREENGY